MDDYFKKFNALVLPLRMAGADNVWYCEKVHNVNIENATPDQIKDSTGKVKGVFFLQHGDKARFGARIHEIERTMHGGRDEWPSSVVEASHIMVTLNHLSYNKAYYKEYYNS